jgi:predicted nucleotidyltransferase
MVHNWNNVDFEIILRLIKGELHLRRLSDEIKIPHSTISRRIKDLRNQSILDYNLEGKNNNYFLKKNTITKNAVFMSENYKSINLLNKYPILLPLFQDVIKESNCEIIILFGSYAKGDINKNSDIDVFLETTDLNEKRKIEKINDLISVKIGKLNSNDLLIKEIIKNHVIIKGVEKYYEKIKFFG